MGESKEGGGDGRSPDPTTVAAGVARLLSKHPQRIDEITVIHLTGQMWALDLTYHGEPSARRFLLDGDKAEFQG